MLQITVPSVESYDEAKGEFVYSKEQTIQLEHSLLSISKWESKWNQPFLKPKEPKTYEQTVDYIKCMTLTQNVNPDIYTHLTNKNIKDITDYIDAPMTATWFSKKPRGSGSREIITSELLYYMMIALQIPFECQKWHLNRLLTLIRVCNEKNAPSKKMSRNELASRNRQLNEMRRSKYHSKG